ncbi:fibroin-3 related protein [Colletotrichum asianum]
MPSIDVAMARSLRGGVWGSVMSSMAATIEKRQIMSTVENVGNQCCGNCCGCCDTPKGTPHKYLDEPYSSNQGYKSQAPMNANSNVPPFLQNQPTHTAHSTAPAPVASGASAPPQYAEFDVSKSGGKEDGDALPAMPSWEGAGSKKVAIEEEVELEQMNKPAASPNPNMPLMAPNAMSHPNSPMPGDRSPYGQNGQAGASGYFPNQSADPYAMNNQGFNNNYDNGYGQSNSSFGVDQYGAAAAAGAAGGMAMNQGRRTPAREFNNNGYGPQRGQTFPPPQHELDGGFGGFEQGGYGMGRPPRNGPSPVPSRAFTAPPRNGPSPAPAGYRRSPAPDYRGSPAPPPADYRRSPAPQDPYRRSPAPQNDNGFDQQDQYGNDNYNRQQYGGGARQYSSESTRPLAAPQRSYTGDHAPQSPDLQNSGGFDFQSGYSRPQQYNYNRGPATGQPMHAEPEEEEQRPPQSSGGTYPGYKAYQPTKEGWSGV